MIKVLNVMEDGRIAGPQLRMLRVAVALDGKVNTVVAIPEKPPFDFRGQLAKAGVPFIELPLTKLSRNPVDILQSLARMPSEILAMKRYIKDNKIDVVHSSGGAWMFKAIIAARLAKTPSVWHLNDTSSPALFRYIARGLLKYWVSAVIVAGSRVKSHYLADFESKYKNKLKLISIDAPVDTSYFLPSHIEESKAVLNLITVGNISPVKDYLTVVKCAGLLQGKLSVRWIVIGASFDSQIKYREEVDKLVEELNVTNLEFIGANTDVHKYLASADIYVCSSAAEASPTSVWEAMSCGLPILSTDVGCVSDHVKEGVNGYVVAPGDDKSMADRIVVLGKSASLRKKMGLVNRDAAVNKFDISVCASKHQEIYKSVCS